MTQDYDYSDDVSLEGIPEEDYSGSELSSNDDGNHRAGGGRPGGLLGASISNIHNLFKPQTSREEWPREESPEAKQQKHIESLQKAQIDQDETLAAVLSEMAEMRAKHAEETARHELEVQALKRKNAALAKRAAAIDKDIDDKFALHEYAKMIQDAGGSHTVDSAYVIRLKSQLTKSLHKMGVMSNQLEMANEDNEAEVKALQNEIVEARNTSTKAEMEFMNDLFVMERECNEMKDDYEARLTSQQELIAQLQIELDLEREMKSDAMSFARHMKEEKRNASSSSTMSLDLVAVNVDDLEKEVREKDKAERKLRTALEARLKEVQTLQSTCAQQEQGMAKLRVDLKTLNYQKSQYAPLVKRESGDGGDRKMPARPKAARGA